MEAIPAAGSSSSSIAQSPRGDGIPAAITRTSRQQIDPGEGAPAPDVQPRNTRRASGSPDGSASQVRRQRVEPSLSVMDTPAVSIGLAQAPALNVAAARSATPLADSEQDTVRGIFQGQVRDAQSMADIRGNHAATFKSVDAGERVWDVCLFVDAQGQPVRMKAWSGTQQIEMRWQHPQDDHWIASAPHLRSDQPYMAAVRRFVQALREEGSMRELLGVQRRVPPGLLRHVSEECLRAVLLSMAARTDDTGRQLREHLVRIGVTPATLHQLNRPQLAAALALPGLRPDVSDLRWWPPTCVGLLIDRLFDTSTARACARTFMTAVYRGSEPVGNGKVWPETFTGGLGKGDSAPRSAQLWFMRAWFFAHTGVQKDGQKHRSSANVLLRRLENAFSVADRPCTMEDVARLTNRDLVRLGMPEAMIRELRTPRTLLRWLNTVGRLHTLRQNYRTNVMPERREEAAPSLDDVLKLEDYPNAEPLQEAIELAIERLQAQCGVGSKEERPEGTVDITTAQMRLRSYARFCRLLDTRPLETLLQASPAASAAFAKLPTPERERANAVFARNRQRPEEVLEHLFDLPMRAQALVIDAIVAQQPVVDRSNLRTVLNTVHPDRLCALGKDTPKDYRSPLQAHQGFIELCEGQAGEDGVALPRLNDRVLSMLRNVLRDSDEVWVPGRLTLMQQSLLFPDGLRTVVVRVRVRDAAGSGMAHLEERVTFRVDSIRPALERLRAQVSGRWIVGDVRYRPEVATNVRWQQQVGEQLRARGMLESAVQRGLRTLGQWMRHHEHDMEFNPFNNHVALALQKQPSALQFLQSVREDLRRLGERLQQALQNERQERQDGLDRAEIELLPDDGPAELELLQAQLEDLASLDEPAVAMAFQVLHEQVWPREASPATQDDTDAEGTDADDAPAYDADAHNSQIAGPSAEEATGFPGFVPGDEEAWPPEYDAAGQNPYLGLDLGPEWYGELHELFDMPEAWPV